MNQDKYPDKLIKDGTTIDPDGMIMDDAYNDGQIDMLNKLAGLIAQSKIVVDLYDMCGFDILIIGPELSRLASELKKLQETS